MEYIIFKQGDLVYCKKFNVISFLKNINDKISSLEITRTGRTYTVESSSKPRNDKTFSLELINIGRTYTREGFHNFKDNQPCLIKLDTYLTRRLCENYEIK